MSKKRQTRNSKKFKKAAASKRARAPMQKGGRMFAGGTSGFDPRTGNVKQAPRRPAGQTTGINPNPMAGIPRTQTLVGPTTGGSMPVDRTTAGTMPLPSPGKRDPSEGTPRPAPRSTGVSERPDNTEGQLPEFTGTVPNTTATGRVFQPVTTTRTPVDDDVGQLPPSDDDGQAKPANAGEARRRRREQQTTTDETFPDRADYTTDDEYQAAVQQYFVDNPIDYSNIGRGNNIFTNSGMQSNLSQAPIDLEINLPDRPDLPQVTPEARAQEDAIAAQAGDPREVSGSTMEASLAEGIDPGVGIGGQLSEGAIAQFEAGEITQPAVAAERDPLQEAEARAVAAQRPEARDYAEAATTDERFEVAPVEGP